MKESRIIFAEITNEVIFIDNAMDPIPLHPIL